MPDSITQSVIAKQWFCRGKEGNKYMQNPISERLGVVFNRSVSEVSNRQHPVSLNSVRAVRDSFKLVSVVGSNGRDQDLPITILEFGLSYLSELSGILLGERSMARAAVTDKTVHMQWMSRKKNNYEWVMVVIASVLGFGVVISLIAFAELANLAHQ